MKVSGMFLLFSFVVFTQSAAARKDFVPGYVVNLEGDTLRGIIKDRDPAPFVELYKKIRFIQNGQRRVNKFSPSEIRGYGYEGVDFRSVRLRESSTLLKISYLTNNSAPFVFLKVISSSDELVLYEQEFVYDDTDLIDSFPLFHIPGSNEMVRGTQGVFGLKKKRLAEYFSMCQALVTAIEQEDIKTPIEVVDFYINRCANQ